MFQLTADEASQSSDGQGDRPWHAEVVKDVVFASKEIKDGDKVVVAKAPDAFSGSLAGKDKLASGQTYSGRAKQPSNAGAWSPWHQQFQSE